MSRRSSSGAQALRPGSASGQPLEIAYVIDSLSSGGAQRQAVETAVDLATRVGIRATFFVYHDIGFYAPRLREAGIGVVLVDKHGRYDPRLPWRLRDAIRRARPTVVHSFLVAPSVWMALGLRLLPRHERPPLLASERNSQIATSPLDRVAQALAYRSSSCVTANAEPVVQEIHRKLGVPLEQLEYIPNGIDLDFWDRERRSGANLPLEPGCLNLACIGRLAPQKNQVLLVEALGLLPKELRERTRLWIIGGEAGSYPSRIRRAVGDRGLADIVHFVEPTRAIAGVIERMDAVVLASSWEGFPNVVLEGMASARPVVATAVGDVPSMLEDGTTGIVVAPRNREALAGALLRLHGMPTAERMAMGARARKVVEERYRMEEVANRYLALYERLSRRRTAPGTA